ncbi:FUSC family protein, partial [Streptomyces sp. NPDC001215]
MPDDRPVVRDVALAAPADSDPEQLRVWARALHGTGPVPQPDDLGEAADELLGVEAELDSPVPPLHRRLGPLGPLALRTAIGCALAGYASLAFGVGRPYWALVTAASIYQANVTLTWSRGVQRVVGNLAGVLVFAAIAPLAHQSRLSLVLCGLALNFGAEALIGRNYWLGSVCVTPMALLITEFAHYQEPGTLMADRVLDTLVGALLGFVAAVVVTNRRAGDRIENALAALERARVHAAGVVAAEHPEPGALETARRGLAAAVVDLRAVAERLAEENARLVRRERLDVVPTKVLGLFVVGTLARRWKVGVVLSRTPGGGVTATVEIPSSLLLRMSPVSAPTAAPTSAPVPAGYGPCRRAISSGSTRVSWTSVSSRGTLPRPAP